EAHDGVAPQELKVVEPDKFAGATDLRIGEAEPCAESERIGQKHQQQCRRRKQEQQTEDVAVVKPAARHAAAAARLPPRGGRSTRQIRGASHGYAPQWLLPRFLALRHCHPEHTEGSSVLEKQIPRARKASPSE